ncbi:acyltransferase family protein [Nonomuraea phyllanthi]|uniref:Acyltransferase family protein n=1 Tax=Nonomuraea phyllanthi TaxID=2219224 RepID=A0A5C4VZN7_9ACTN|nr:acyltransferase family protein [Nonomuraea phyllanthi]QFY13949.1 acyltransferase family protein [Nonomuraea phyllanthi]
MTAERVATRGRLAGLDGLRGLAALFVVLHHCWLLSFPGFPLNDAPAWTGWLRYGHFAVVVFIVLSGFSLAVSPARSGWRLGGAGTFFNRRAWRILPPYWAALLFSLVIAWTVIPQPGQEVPTGKSVVIYGLLLQDVFGSPSPNGALWSIAVEAQLYLVFPLMLLVVRRMGAAVMLGAVTAVVVAVGALAPAVPAVDLLMRLTPQFAALFAMGAVCAGVVRTPEPGEERAKEPGRLPWPWLAAAAALPVLLLIVVAGPVWVVENFFWVDLAVGPAAGLLLAGVATGRPVRLVRLLDTRPLRRLGSFSYSLYLIHAPLVVMVNRLVVAPHVPPGMPVFVLTLVLGVPVSVGTAWLFASVFELPFQRHRSWKGLRDAVRARFR